MLFGCMVQGTKTAGPWWTRHSQSAANGMGIASLLAMVSEDGCKQTMECSRHPYTSECGFLISGCHGVKSGKR
ncbi:hypothetical protein PR202_gb12742 [Eleusine coracana subsp. coracana]|uniref:Uncharacterized protein n=1 Tax=Eleusine coracana subsp. coracana TaxID=191504 RepID=A0AAV5EQD0_ELECO|nr:hypothetical protein PR202_gb12742 [Eleusine coracana subsp. coracana]